MLVMHTNGKVIIVTKNQKEYDEAEEYLRGTEYKEYSAAQSPIYLKDEDGNALVTEL